jgi:proton glutamate symport protein
LTSAKMSGWIPPAILLAVVLGAVAGYFVPGFFTASEFVGIILVNVLKIVAIPLILVSVVVGIASLGDLARLGRTGMTTLLYFLGTTAVAAVIGLAVVLVMQPGTGFPESLKDAANWPQVSAESKSVSDILSQIIPSNLMSALGSGQFLGLILLAFCMGGLLAALGGRVRTLITFFRQANDVVMELVRFVLPFAPVGVFWLIGAAVARDSQYLAKTSAMGWLVLTLVIGLLIHALVVLPVVLKVWGKRSPLALARDTGAALLTAFGTSSAAATLPVTYEAVTERSRVDRRASSLVLPLGSVVNLNGTAMFLVVAAVFLAQAFGVELSLLQWVGVVVASALMTFAAAGVPHAAVLMLTSVMTMAGFPSQAFLALGLVFAIEWLLGRLATVVDVWGDIVGAAVVAESLELKLAGTGASYRSGPTDRGRGLSDRGRAPRSDRGPRERGDRRGPDHRDQDRPRPEPLTVRSGPGDSTTARPPRSTESPFAISGGGGPVLGPPVKLEPVGEDRPTRERSADDRPKEGPRREGADRRRDRDRRPPRDQRDEGGERRERGRRPEGKRPFDRNREDRGGPEREREREQRQTGPDGATRDAAREKSRLDPDVVARELARVSAQLSSPEALDGTGERPADPGGSMDDRGRAPENIDFEQVDQPSEIPEVIRPSYDEIETPDEPWQESEEEEAFAADIEEYADEDELTSEVTDKTELEQRPDDIAPEETTDADERDVAFGRSKARRGAALKREGGEVPPSPADTPAPRDSFSTEDATFGRGRRKRTR